MDRNNVKSIVYNDLYYKDEYIYAKNSKFDFVKPVSIKKEPIISKRLFLKAKNNWQLIRVIIIIE
ncbi:MAG: hypothetical protein K9H14_02540 [Actinomycetia bacterium]|nr:hypothetical protein [Actinomycetes bacterium]